MSLTPESVREEYRPKLRQNLEENILEFWYPKSVDFEHGGYVTSYDRTGEFAGNDDKMIVTQSRMVWLFSRLVREGYDGDDHDDGDYLEAAEVGYDFLVGEMWDEEHGGFYWEVDRTGEVLKPNKHMYGQSFALYALSEYYRATGDECAKRRADELFELFEREAYDAENGGYVEYFERDWTPISSGRTYLDNIEPDWSPKESGDAALDPSMKLMNTHLHLMEAFTTYFRAEERPLVRKRLTELLTILTNTVVRKDLTACTDKYDPDWQPRLDGEYRIVSYGHDVENVWLTMDVCEVLDVPETLLRDLYERLFEYSLEYGYDDEHGGFYFYGPFESEATNRIKAWWVQAEALTAALRMFELTDDPSYLSVFAETYDFVDEYQVDWERGEWHSGVDEDLEPVGRKGAIYKGAYHNGRAMLECLAALDRL